MGRGRSSSSSSGGRKATAKFDANGVPTQLTAESVRDFFDTATPAQADAFLARIRSIPLGDREQPSDVQRFFNAIGWTSREPVVLDEKAWQSEWNKDGNPQRYYHSDYPANGVSSQEFAQQYMGKSYTFNGEQRKQFMSGGIHGDGTYFAQDASDSFGYGDRQFRGYLNSNAKVANKRLLRDDMFNFRNNHPGFDHFIKHATTGYSKTRGGNQDGLLSVFAAMRGYNVIKNWDYISVLDRSATTVSSNVKARPARYGRTKNW